MKSEQGQTLVEFALILPLLLLLVIGIFDFGLALNAKNNLNFLANTAARYAEVNQCLGCTDKGKDTIASYVQSTADTNAISGSVTITFCLPPLDPPPNPPPANDGSAGSPLRVTAKYNFPWLAGISLPGLPSGGIAPMTSTVTVRILQAPDATSPALYKAPLC